MQNLTHPTTTTFTRLTAEHLAYFRSLLGDRVLTDADSLHDYAHDWTEDLVFSPEVVLKPETTEEVSAILRYCHEHTIAVTPMGARTGLSGGMLPIYGGVALATDRMNRILNIDLRSLQITLQPGVINQHISDALEPHGLFYPPDPSSKGSCLIGGNLAENAGGLHAVKYGITKDYVLALEVVLANGDIIRTGAKVLKDSTGYNLTQLVVGSEGTLGVITEATLKVVPKPAHTALMLAPFATAEGACDAVSAIFRAGVIPSALEFMEPDAINFGQKHLGINTYSTEGVGGHLLIEVDGSTQDQIMNQCEQIAGVLEQYGVLDIQLADTAEQQQQLWRLRKCLGEAVKGNTIYKEEDTVVPRAELAKLLAKVKEVSKRYGFQSVCYGHAGDGNLHVNIIKGDLSDHIWNEELPKAITEIFEYTVSLGGTLSGEHGIGYVQRRYMPLAFSPLELGLMRGIKQLFDPKGILNPGKIFPEA